MSQDTVSPTFMQVTMEEVLGDCFFPCGLLLASWGRVTAGNGYPLRRRRRSVWPGVDDDASGDAIASSKGGEKTGQPSFRIGGFTSAPDAGPRDTHRERDQYDHDAGGQRTVVEHGERRKEVDREEDGRKPDGETHERSKPVVGRHPARDGQP